MKAPLYSDEAKEAQKILASIARAELLPRRGASSLHRLVERVEKGKGSPAEVWALAAAMIGLKIPLPADIANRCLELLDNQRQFAIPVNPVYTYVAILSILPLRELGRKAMVVGLAKLLGVKWPWSTRLQRLVLLVRLIMLAHGKQESRTVADRWPWMHLSLSIAREMWKGGKDGKRAEIATRYLPDA